MFGSELLEVAIGIVFIYILVSIICSAVREGVETLLKTRSAYLEFGIRELLHDSDGTDLARSFFTHPLIYGLYLDEYIPRGPLKPSRLRRWDRSKRPPLLAKGSSLPSYIPSRNFALALMDLAARGRATNALSSSPGSTPITLASLRQNVLNLRNEAVQRALLSAIDTAENDIQKVQTNLEAWYDSGMDRVSGWYKRSTQWIVLWIGLAIAIVFNVNTITIADYLYRNDAQREALVARAEAAARDTGTVQRDYVEARAALDSLTLPIGWERTRMAPGELRTPRDVLAYVLLPVLGWLLTAVAATLGAPFWFDVLNRVMVIRSTVKPHEKSGDEASEDRQNRPEATTRVEVEAERDASPGAAAVAAMPGDEADPGDVEGDVDACEVEMDDETPDDELPQAEGGVG